MKVSIIVVRSGSGTAAICSAKASRTAAVKAMRMASVPSIIVILQTPRPAKRVRHQVDCDQVIERGGENIDTGTSHAPAAAEPLQVQAGRPDAIPHARGVLLGRHAGV